MRPVTAIVDELREEAENNAFDGESNSLEIFEEENGPIQNASDLKKYMIAVKGDPSLFEESGQPGWVYDYTNVDPHEYENEDEDHDDQFIGSW